MRFLIRRSLKNIKKITDQLQNINLIVKPVDSSGSKGVTKLSFSAENASNIKFAFDNAIQFSKSKQIIVEELINKNGNQICGDGIIVNGKVIFIGYGDGHYYDENNYANAPFAESFPSKHDNLFLKKCTDKIETILCKVGYFDGIFNIDVLNHNQEPFIVEIGQEQEVILFQI